MAFMVPEILCEDFLVIETKNGETYPVPADVVNLSFREADNTPIDELTDDSSLQAVQDYCEGEPAKVSIVRGKYWCRLSAPGYLDATDWSGPHDSEDEAKHSIATDHDVCASCGEDFEEGEEGDICASCKGDDEDSD